MDKEELLYHGWGGTAVVLWCSLAFAVILGAVAIFGMESHTFSGGWGFALVMLPCIPFECWAIWRTMTRDTKTDNVALGGALCLWYPFAWLFAAWAGGGIIFLLCGLVYLIGWCIGQAFSLIFMGHMIKS